MRLPPLTALLLVATIAQGSSCRETPSDVRIGVLVWPPYELFYLARDLGHYDDVDVQLVDYHTPAEAMRAYQNDVIDGVALTTDFLLQVSEREEGHRAVLVIDYSAGGDCLIAQPGIRAIADLRGKTIGLEMSTLGQHMLTRALESAQIELDDVELRFYDMPDHAAAYRSGEVDALITYEPVRTHLLDDGGSLLFDSTAIPTEISDVLFFREALIDERQETLRAVVDGYFAALDYLHREPELAATLRAPREGVSPEQFLHALTLVRLPDREENQRLLGGDAPGLILDAARIRDILVRAGKVSPGLSLVELTDDRLVRDHDG